MNEEQKIKCKKNLLRYAKRRAKKKGLEFRLTLDDIQIPDLCPVLRIQMESGGDPYNSPSIERIDRKKGYVPENIMIISYQANVSRHVANPEDLIKIGLFYKDLEEREKIRKLKEALRATWDTFVPQDERDELEKLIASY